MATWRDKAHREIGKLCLESYKETNQKHDGSYYKKHRGYAVPALAQELIECLRDNDELRAKSIFVNELLDNG